MFKKKYVTLNKDWKYLQPNNFYFISSLISMIQKIIERVFSVKIIKKKIIIQLALMTEHLIHRIKYWYLKEIKDYCL